MKLLWGIDPGVYGALCEVELSSPSPHAVERVRFYPLPRFYYGTGSRYVVDPDGTADLIRRRSLASRPSLAVVENFVGKPGNASSSIYSQAFSVGVLVGSLSVLEVRYELLYPVQWRKRISDLGLEFRKKAKEGVVDLADRLGLMDLIDPDQEDEVRALMKRNARTRQGFYDSFLIALSGLVILEEDDAYP